VLARSPNNLLDFDRRIHAVLAFQKLPEASALAAANKRVNNILKKQGDAAATFVFDKTLLQQAEEKALAEQIDLQADTVKSLYQDADYTQALSILATLKEPVDLFFDRVMVMVDDEAVRNNRLALLSSLHGLLTRVADIALLP
jgi:glycyl-tRNA synthetase beta chain